MPIISSLGYPTIEDVMKLARSHINDAFPGLTDTPGEGQILTDDPVVSPFTLPFLKSAIRKVYRQLGNAGDPALIKDNVIVGPLPIIQSPAGPGLPDPGLQTQLSFVGYFDGVDTHGTLVLPADCVGIIRMWERLSGTNDPFTPIHQSTDGLPSRNQGSNFGVWEWRENAANFLGALTQRDIRLRYQALLATVGDSDDFSTTSIPILDSTDALAYLVAAFYASSRGAINTSALDAKALVEIRGLQLRQTRRSQSVSYHRPPYEGGSS